MLSEEELKKRAWPEKSTVPVGNYSPYVTCGRVFNRALRLKQALSEPIPAGECAITSLCCGSDGRIYGATSGRQSHLFLYDPAPEEDSVYDLGVLPGATSVDRALVSGAGCLYGAISDGPEKGRLFRYTLRKGYVKETVRTLLFGEISYLPCPLLGESIVSLVLDSKRLLLYGLGRKSGLLFCYSVSEEKLITSVNLDKHGRFSEALVLDQHGNIYGCAGPDFFFKSGPGYLSLETLNYRLPTVAGRSLYNRLQAAVYHEKEGLIYGAGSADGILFAFSPDSGRGYTIGKPTAAAGCPVLLSGKDNCLYGLNGSREGMAHLFRYELTTRSLDDLGILYASSEIPWHGYEFASGCVGTNGELYLGETDRISHLFLYFPPHRT